MFDILDGATTLLTVEEVNTTQGLENITVPQELLRPVPLAAQNRRWRGDQAFMTDTWVHFYQSNLFGAEHTMAEPSGTSRSC